MKIFNVLNCDDKSKCKVEKGVKLHSRFDLREQICVHLGGERSSKSTDVKAINIHRTEPHVNRLTKIAEGRLFEANPVFRVRTSQLELGSDVLRDDPARAIVVIRGAIPVCWEIQHLIGDVMDNFDPLSELARNAIGSPILLAENTPDGPVNPLHDSMWILRSGQGIKVNRHESVVYAGGALKVRSSIEWRNETRNRIYHSDDVWV